MVDGRYSGKSYPLFLSGQARKSLKHHSSNSNGHWSGSKINVEVLIKYFSPQLRSPAASAGFISESFTRFVVLSLVEKLFSYLYSYFEILLCTNSSVQISERQPGYKMFILVFRLVQSGPDLSIMQ